MNKIISLIAGLDTKVIYIVCGVIIVLGVLALIKKIISIGITIIVIALMMSYGGSVMDKIKEEYGVGIQGSIISMDIGGEKQEIDVSLIDSIEKIGDSDAGKVNILVISGENEVEVEVPIIVYMVLDGMVG